MVAPGEAPGDIHLEAHEMHKPGTAAGLCLALLASSVMACQWVMGEPPAPSEPAATATSAPPPSPTSLPDLTGTHWFIYYTEPGGAYYEYELRFQPNGRLENSHPNESTPDNDTWAQSGDLVILLFNDSYATYTGRLDGDTMTGTAVNITGADWAWDAYRLR